MMRTTVRGFTLIELVVVITILGILAAFAVPKFLSLDKEARSAAVRGLEGSLRSASSLAHSLYLAQGSTGTVSMEGTTITMGTVNASYPAATAAGIEATLQDRTGFTVAGAAGPPATYTFTKTGAATAATCIVRYTEPTSATTAPVVFADTAGC